MGFMDNISGLFDPIKKKRAQTDPLAFLQLEAGPSSQDLYADALAQVGNAYQAQIGNLNAQERDVKNRQKKGDAQLGAMYGALSRDIGKNAGDIKKTYGSAIDERKKGTASTKSAISNTYKQTNNELASLFSRLGIQAAAPDALAQGNEDRNFLSGLVDFSGNSAQNALNINRSAALDYNTAQQNIAGLTGKNRRADLLDQLNDTLSGIGQQRNSLYGQMADAVSQRQYQLEQDALQRQNQLQQMMFQMQQQQMESAAAGQPTFSQQWSTMGGNERASYKASNLFGNDASYAMQLLTGVANNQNNGVYPNQAHFIRSILAENEKQKAAGNPYLDPDELQALASYYWSEGGVSTKPKQDYLSRLS